jgi:hypothetical protein
LIGICESSFFGLVVGVQRGGGCKK